MFSVPARAGSEPSSQRGRAQRRSLSVLLLAHARDRRRRTPAGLCQRAAARAWLTTACTRWTARPSWKKACSGSTNRTNAWSSRSRPFWACSNGVCSRVRSLSPHADESFRTLLDRMISMTHGLFPAVSDLAREVRYRYFDQPLFEQARKQVYERSGRAPRLSRRQSGCRRPPRESPRAGRMPAAAGRACSPAGSQPPTRLAQIDVGGAHLAVLPDSNARELPLPGDGRAVLRRRPNTIMRASAFTSSPRTPSIPSSPRRSRALFPLIEEVPADHDIVIDFYAWHPGGLGDPEATQQEVQRDAQPGWLSRVPSGASW